MKRKRIPLMEKLAAVLGPRTALPYEQLKQMPAKDVCACFEWDHWPIRHVDGGPDVHWNLEPKLKKDHVEKTKRDVADLAHERKVRRSEAEHKSRMTLLGKDPGSVINGAIKGEPRRRHRWPRRPMRSRRSKWRC